MKPLLAAPMGLFLIAASAGAGEVADFETAFRAVYGEYRAALFATNSGDADKSAKALAKFEAGWEGLSQRYADVPPPHYADDPDWGGTLARIEDHLAAASADVGAGALPEAHEALEGIRDEVGALHERNGIALFSDRMNAYHAAMERVLAIDPASVGPESLPTILEHAGILSFLAAEIARLPAPEAAGSDDYAPLDAAFQASVAGFRTAAEAGDPDAIRAAMKALKPAYSKFFLKFG